MRVCVCVCVCVTCCGLLLPPGRRFCCGLSVSWLQPLLCSGSSSQCDVQGNGLRMIGLIISVTGVVADGISWDGGLTTASVILSKHFSSFAAIILTAGSCSISFGVFDNIPSVELSSFTVITGITSASNMNSFTATPDTVCSVRIVLQERAAPDGQVGVGHLHLHNGPVYTVKVAASRLGQGLHCKPAV